MTHLNIKSRLQEFYSGISFLKITIIKWIFITFIAAFIGLLTSVEQYVLAGVVFLLIVAPLLSVLIISNFDYKHDLIFWFLFTSVMFSSVASAVTRSSWSFVPSGLLLLFSPFIITGLYKVSKGFRDLKFPIFIIIFFYVLTLVSSILGRSAFFPAFYSMIMSLKPILLVFLGCALVWSHKSEKYFDNIVKWAWLPLLIFALAQWFSPSMFKIIVSVDSEVEYGANPFFPAFSKASSLFGQSSVLASFSAMLGLILFTKSIVYKRTNLILLSGFYLILLLMSGQRQEILSFLTCIPLIYFIYKWKPNFLLLILVSISALTLVIASILLVSPDVIYNEMDNWHISAQNLTSLSARAVLYSDSISLANNYWPWGSGFGTFASVGAVKYDQSLYVDLGYRAFWWFVQQKSWLMDAYWAKYIAESGWLGFGSVIALYIFLLRQVVIWIASKEVGAQAELLELCILAFIGLFYVLINSPTAFNLAEPHGGLIPLMYYGLAWSKVSIASTDKANN